MNERKTTKNCPHCGKDAENTIILGDADPRLEGLLECGCGAVFTERAAGDSCAQAYRHPRNGIEFFRAPQFGRYVTIPGATLF